MVFPFLFPPLLSFTNFDKSAYDIVLVTICFTNPPPKKKKDQPNKTSLLRVDLIPEIYFRSYASYFSVKSVFLADSKLFHIMKATPAKRKSLLLQNL